MPRFDPRTEARTYPFTWRITARSLDEIGEYLEPDEEVLITAPGQSVAATGRMQTEYGPRARYQPQVLAATSRRLLALHTAGVGNHLVSATALPYAEITEWHAERSRSATLLTRTGEIRAAAGVHQIAVNRIPKRKFVPLLAVVVPRLPQSATGTLGQDGGGARR